MKLYQRFGSALLAAGMGLLAGCAAPSYNVEVYLSPKFKEQMKIYPSLEVDVVGVNTNEAERFDTCVTDDYFTVGNALRSGTDHFTIMFSEDSSAPKLLRSSHKIWKQFGRKDADQLYLLVNLPPDGSKKLSGKDARKIVIPLENGWFDSDKRFFEISPAGIISLKNRPAGYPSPVDAAKKTGEEK